MKVLLVDDEIFTIRMLQSLIQWKELGLELIGYALDGQEAYDKIFQEKPDIIISDIKMPGMNGLELLKKVMGLSLGIKMILMSAYADFSFVKEAIRHGGCDYILKPIDEAELEQALRKVITDICGEKEQEKVISKSVRQLERINLYHFMRTGHGINKISRVDDKFWSEEHRYVVFMLLLHSRTINEYNNSNNMEMAQEGYLARIMEDILSRKGAAATVFDFEEGIWTILLEEADMRKPQEIAEELLCGIRERAGVRMNACFSACGSNLEELPLHYEEVKDLSKYSFYIGEEDVLGYGYNCNKGELDEVRDIGRGRELDQAIKEHDAQQVSAILNEVFELTPEHYPSEQKKICDLCYQTVLAIRRTMSVEEQKTQRYQQLCEVTYEKLAEIPSLQELKQLILKLVDEMPGMLNPKTYSQPVESSLTLIREKYNQDLSLEEICAEIAVSKNYFCYLFKRETGMSLWNYLTVIRMQHAKQLLLESDLKSYEIAFQVGYENPSYFSKLFKKYEHMTPNEYREHKE